MITAKKIADKYYPDIYMNREYEVEDIRDYLYLKGNKRHYQKKYFEFFRKGRRITQEHARAYVILEKL